MQDMSLPGSVDARSRNDDGGRLAPRLLGCFRPRGARSVWFLAAADGSLAVCFAAVWLGPCARALRGSAPMGRLAHWRICGAIVGTRCWSEGFERCL